MTSILFTIGSVLLVSAVSLVGIAFVFLRNRSMERILFPLVSFAAGGLIGNVFLHLLPEIAAEDPTFSLRSSTLIVMGILVSFFIEKIILWRHHHCLGCDAHTKTAGPMILVGDAAHNITDGILIASSYLVDVQLGIATTIAVILHEIPQEIGDFAVLLYSGYAKTRAILLNFLSALTALLGAIAVLLLHTSLPHIERYLLPIIAGNFLYIAIADLLPELHKQTKLQHATMQLIAVAAGILLMFALTFAE